MKYAIILTSFILFLISCKKNNDLTNIPDTITNITRIADSCSFTIEGKQYIFDIAGSNGRENAHANFDIALNKWDTDTLQYRTMSVFSKISNPTPQNDGSIIIYFVKKYHKNLLVKQTGVGSIMAPETDSPLYVKGNRNYAVDFNRFNSQDGIAMVVATRTNTSNEILVTYIYAPAFYTTTLNNDCQSNSQFEILNVYKDPADGRRIIEARFTANLFDINEKIKRLENGYMRIHTD